jgi:phytoene synthase
MDEIISQAIPQGSSVYYSLRFIAPAKRQAIAYLFAFSQEIEKIVALSQSPEITQRKLQWWQQELACATPSHPLHQAIRPIVEEYAIPTSVLHEVLAGIAKRLAYASYPDFKAYSEQHYRAISSFPLWVSLVMTEKSEPKPLMFVHDLGIFLQTVELIHDLRRDLQLGYIFLPEQELVRHQVAEQDLLSLKSSPNLQAALQELAEQARHYYSKAKARLNKQQMFTQAPSLILAELYDKLLSEIANEHYDVLQKQLFLSPIRKLWFAWRLQQRLKKCLSS